MVNIKLIVFLNVLYIVPLEYYVPLNREMGFAAVGSKVVT